MQHTTSPTEAHVRQSENEIKAQCLREIVEHNLELGNQELAEMYLLRIRCEDITEQRDLQTIAHRIARLKDHLSESAHLERDSPDLDALEAVKQAALRAGGVRQFLAQVREVNEVARLVGDVERLQVFLEALDNILSDPYCSAQL